jgi:hypothetical protein
MALGCISVGAWIGLGGIGDGTGPEGLVVDQISSFQRKSAQLTDIERYRCCMAKVEVQVEVDV